MRLLPAGSLTLADIRSESLPFRFRRAFSFAGSFIRTATLPAAGAENRLARSLTFPLVLVVSPESVPRTRNGFWFEMTRLSGPLGLMVYAEWESETRVFAPSAW